MEVVLGDKVVPLEIIRKNNKNIYFRVKDGILYVTAHRFVSENEIKRLIKKNEESLLKMYTKVVKKEDKDLQFTYLGKPFVKVFDETIKGVVVEDGFIYAKNESAFDKWYKNECIKVFSDRIKFIVNYFDNIPKFSLRIRNMKTRWGVNNVTKCIITLNSELLKKDISLIDYVIVHELCHFYEANHSKRFWYQVGLRYPNYKEARKALRS